MQLLEFIFRLGVLFAIYGFLWGLIEIAISLLRTGSERSIAEIYLIKAIKYFFLVDVTFLFCSENIHSNIVSVDQGIIAGIILLTYFIGKMQQRQTQMRFFQMGLNGMPVRQQIFSLRAEVIIIAIAMLMFSFFWLYPRIAYNPLSQWFHDSIVNIENTPVFGFIFKVIGFFFMLSMIFKVVNAFAYLLSGAAMKSSERNNNQRDENDFDDYEEIN